MNNNKESSAMSKGFFSKIVTGSLEFIEEYKIQRPRTSKIVMLTIAGCLLALIILFTHNQTIHSKADSFDDYQYAFNNVLVKNPSLHSVERFFKEVLYPSTVEGYYQPLAMVSLMIDSALGGSENNVAVFHITSLLIHIVNSFLVLILIYMLFDKIWLAFIGGTLFGIHPVSVEVIAWLSERKSLLATLFLLLSLILYIKYVKSTKRLYLDISIVVYALALLSKPIAVSLPVIIFLLDYFWYNRLKLSTILEKIPYFVLALIFTIIAYISQKNTATLTNTTQTSTILQIILLVCYNNFFYLWKLFVPNQLSPFYSEVGAISLSNPIYLISFIFTILIIIFFVITRKKSKSLLFCYLFYIISILPTSGIIKVANAFTCSKYSYFPSIGIVFILIVLFSQLSKLKNHKKLSYLIIFVLVFSIFIGEISLSNVYASKWKDTETLNKHMLDINPQSSIILNALARTYMVNLNFDKAIEYLEESIKYNPDSSITYVYLATIFQLTEREAEAVEMYNKALELGLATKSTISLSLYNLGKIYLANNYIEEAKQYFEESINQNPNHLPSHFHLALSESRLGNFEKSVFLLKDMINKYPSMTAPYVYLGIVYGENELYNEAITQLNYAITLNPYDSFIYYTLGNVLVNFGKFEEAEMCYKESIKLDPEKVDTYNEFARFYAQQGKYEHAIDLLQESISIFKGSEAYILLGDVYKDTERYEEAIAAYEQALSLNPDIDYLHEYINSLKEKVN